MFSQRLWEWLDRPAANCRTPSAPRRRVRLTIEPLEDRTVPASFTVGSVPELIAGITTANQTVEADTITLAPGKTFTLTAVNNIERGTTGLPVIAANGGPLTIIGNGDVIERSTAKKTPAFRLFTVEGGASLTLHNLTLQGGLADHGGAIYNLGTLTLHGVTVQKNIAKDGALGGGIYSNGSLMLQNCLIQNNQAIGYDGVPASKTSDHDGGWDYSPGTDGGFAGGGGLYVAGGTASLLGTTVTNNTAKGGQGGARKYGQPAGRDGYAAGGGVYIASGASVSLDAFTVDHVMRNQADFYPDIDGTFTSV